MASKLEYYQQGDVLLNRVGKLPNNAKKLNTAVLQLGEVTGHKHQFLNTTDVEVYVDEQFAGQEMTITPDEGKFVVVFNKTALTHEEHKPVIVEPGIYQVDIVREFDYDKMEAARVAD